MINGSCVALTQRLHIFLGHHLDARLAHRLSSDTVTRSQNPPMRPVIDLTAPARRGPGLQHGL